MWNTTRATSVVIAVAAVTIFAAGPPPREIANVAAFARLYGVVRFFYPGDAAADADWDSFAIAGIARVRTARDANDLTTRLRELFTPFGPGIEIGSKLTAYRPPRASDEPLIAWRYLGAGATTAVAGSPYKAKRTHRPRRVSATIEGFAGLAQNLPAVDFRGRRIRLRGKIRATATDSTGGGALWLRVDRRSGAGFFDNMSDRPVRDADWRDYAIEGPVADDATNVSFGVLATGVTLANFDALELSVRTDGGDWQPVTIKDAGFEAAADSSGWLRVGSAAAQVWRLSDSSTPEGRQFAQLGPPEVSISNDELFDAPPAAGGHVDIDLGEGLHARVALTLTDAQAKLGAPTRLSASSHDEVDARLADIVIAWNFYRHFYPYFPEAAVNWDTRLVPQLEAAYEATTRRAEGDALRRLVADARDGHGRVNDTRLREIGGTLPVQLGIVESRVAVVASRAPAEVPVGALVSTIGGSPALDRIAAAAQLASGTTQWKEFSALQETSISACADGNMVALTIDSGSGPRGVTVPCARAQRPEETRPQPVAEITPGVWYVDLTRARTTDLTPVIQTLSRASAVVFDVRGYPTEAGKWILPHLLGAGETDRWMHVAKITGPFGQSAGWQDFGWDLKPAAPKITGKIVFMTDARAISYAESVMGYVSALKLGTIVGGKTAGTNGNIATFSVPSGFTLVFTGMRVTGHDGRSPYHLVGVTPDILATPTIAGLRTGRDDVLERALSLVR